MKALLWIGIAVFCGAPCAAFELTSPDFADTAALPRSATCDGAGQAPALAWSGAPEGTKGFALICTDPDAPAGEFTHWIVYAIPATVSAIQPGGRLPAGSRELENDYGKPGFGPACPPSGTHRYVFTLYALKGGELNASSRDELLSQVQKAQIGPAKLTGTYKRKQ